MFLSQQSEGHVSLQAVNFKIAIYLKAKSTISQQNRDGNRVGEKGAFT